MNPDQAHLHNPDLLERWFEKLARTIAFDFDGVLHPYSAGWTGSTPADEPPIPGAKAFLRTLAARGFRIVVFSTRCDHPEGLEGTKAWLDKWGLSPFIDDVTCTKPAAVAYVDDRAVPFAGEWEPVLDGIEALVTGGNVRGAGKQPDLKP